MRGIYVTYPALRRQIAKKIDSARESITTIAGSNICSYNISIGYVYVLHMLSICLTHTLHQFYIT